MKAKVGSVTIYYQNSNNIIEQHGQIGRIIFASYLPFENCQNAF
jgi:hypothetical protein